MGGLTKRQASDIFTKKYKNLDNTKLTITYKNEKITTLTAQTLGLRSNTEQIVDRAYEVFRTPLISSRISQKMNTLFHLVPYEFKTGVDYNEGVIWEYINDISDQNNKPAKNALFSFEDGKVTSFSEHVNGLKINDEQFIKDVEKKYPNWIKKKKTNKLPLLTVLLNRKQLSARQII